MHDYHSILPGIRSRYNLLQVRRRLRNLDLTAVDIDECLFPGFSQSVLGYLIFFRLMTRPRRLTDLRLVPQLLSGGVYIRKKDLLRRMGHTPTNQELMLRYEQSMRMIPECYFRRGAEAIPGRSFNGALETLRLLGQRTTLGLISFGIDVISEEYQRQINRGGNDCVRFLVSNRILFRRRPCGVYVFEGYRQPLLTEPGDKLRALQQRLADLKLERPLVIGNGRDEAEMAALARERGGLSIGFRPRPADQRAFDLLVDARDWRPLLRLVKGSLQ